MAEERTVMTPLLLFIIGVLITISATLAVALNLQGRKQPDFKMPDSSSINFQDCHRIPPNAAASEMALARRPGEAQRGQLFVHEVPFFFCTMQSQASGRTMIAMAQVPDNVRFSPKVGEAIHRLTRTNDGHLRLAAIELMSICLEKIVTDMLRTMSPQEIRTIQLNDIRSELRERVRIDSGKDRAYVREQYQKDKATTVDLKLYHAWGMARDLVHNQETMDRDTLLTLEAVLQIVIGAYAFQYHAFAHRSGTPDVHTVEVMPLPSPDAQLVMDAGLNTFFHTGQMPTLSPAPNNGRRPGGPTRPVNPTEIMGTISRDNTDGDGGNAA